MLRVLFWEVVGGWRPGDMKNGWVGMVEIHVVLTGGFDMNDDTVLCIGGNSHSHVLAILYNEL